MVSKYKSLPGSKITVNSSSCVDGKEPINHVDSNKTVTVTPEFISLMFSVKPLG
jgi:hypothetical protein